MKKAFLIFVAALCAPSLSSAASTNTEPGLITQIKANWANDGKDTLYYYKFNGKGGGCQGSWIASGDDNINQVLLLAYSSGTLVKLGVPGGSCVITTVETQK